MKPFLINPMAQNATTAEFGARIAARLDESAQELPDHVAQRLCRARMQALSHGRQLRRQVAPVLATSGGLRWIKQDHFGFWGRASSVLPLIALLIGLMSIGILQEQQRAHEIAEVDTELLTSDLPPVAYTDPGFAQYLKAGGQD